MMHEIWIVEAIITVFIIIYFLRPFLKKLWPLDGLVWLPVLALLITIGIFFAYGFRPECVPLLVFEVILGIANIPALVSSAASLPNEDFRDRRVIFSLLALIFMGGSIALMFIFSPKVPLNLVSDGLETRNIRDTSARRDYFMRIYTPERYTDSETRPVLFLIPPEAGSISAIDRICVALRDRGFTVISYSRRGFDFPAVDEHNRRYFASPTQMRSWWQAFRNGTALKTANDQGKSLEAERLRDIEFLLPHVQDIAAEAPLFLAGYNAGGGAAVLLAGNSGFSSRYPAVRGIIVVESRLWSAYIAEPPVFPEVPANAPWYQRFRVKAANWFTGLKAIRVTGLKPLAPPDIPVLCLVSDRALSDTGELGPYRALRQTFNHAKTMEMAVVAGAGPLDLCAYPLTHPLYSFLFPAAQRAVKNNDPVGLVVQRIETVCRTWLSANPSMDLTSASQ